MADGKWSRCGDSDHAAVTRAYAALIRAGAILMVRHRHDGRDYWTLPGGGVEAGESPAEGAVREVWEETGLRVTISRPLFERPWLGYGRATVEHEQCFLVEIDGGGEPALGHDPELVADAQMLVDVAWFMLDSARDDVQVSKVLEAL